MSAKKAVLFGIATFYIIALGTSAVAQKVRLTGTAGGDTLWLDMDRVYSYNLYEGSRLGGGLVYDIALRNESYKKLSLGGYAGYGYTDQRWKWGLSADLAGRSKRESHTYIEFFHDLTRDASRVLNTFRLKEFTETGSFMARLFSDTYRLTLGHSRKLTSILTADLRLRLSSERYMHNFYYLLYPATRADLLAMPSTQYAELILTLAMTKGWTIESACGLLGAEHSDGSAFARLLAQYNRTIDFSVFRYLLFTQGGVTTPNIPYSRMFDLGGTWGSSFFFDQSILSARPNEFTANIFTLVAMRLTLQKPLFDYYDNILQLGMRPNPFLILDAAWGKTWNNQMFISPDKGIAEVGAGIDGILALSQMDLGIGVVYRLTPASSVYHFTNDKDNLSILFSIVINM